METDNLVLEHLRAIRAEMGRLADKQSEAVGRLSALEHHHANTTREIASVAREIAEIRASIDRHDERLARIERRLTLVDA
jgi:septal ring factor EnvC (AmiA/AmiB activator)